MSSQIEGFNVSSCFKAMLSQLMSSYTALVMLATTAVCSCPTIYYSVIPAGILQVFTQRIIYTICTSRFIAPGHVQFGNTGLVYQLG